MTRLAHWFAAAVLLAGCENPGPDPRLDRPGPEDRETAVAIAGFASSVLEFHLTRDSEGVHLRVSKRDLGTLDSAEYLLMVRTPDHGSRDLLNGLRQQLLLEHYGRLGRIPPGGSEEVGLIDSRFMGSLRPHELRVAITRASEDGIRKGNPFGGVYAGTFSGSGANVAQGIAGPVKGWIDANGAFWFALKEGANIQPTAAFTGTVESDGRLGAGCRLLHSFHDLFGTAATGGFSQGPPSAMAEILFHSETPWLDTLRLTLEAYRIE